MSLPDVLKCSFSDINYKYVFKNNKAVKLVESENVSTVNEVQLPNS